MPDRESPWERPIYQEPPEPFPDEPDEPEMPEPFVPALTPLDDDDDDPDDDGWRTPVTLARYADPIPTDALGPILGPLVDALAHELQVPSDVAVTMALPIITTAAAGRWYINIREGWTVNLALAALSVLRSSGGKSPTLARLAQPLYAFEQQARDGAEEEIAEAEHEHKLLADRVEKLRKEVNNKADPDATDRRKKAEAAKLHADYKQAALELAAHKVPVRPRFTVDDITPEAVAKVMSRQGGAIGVISAESGWFQTLAGRYSSGVPNLDNILKGVSGDRISVTRVKDEDDGIIISETALSICLAIQNGMMARLGEKPELRESGLLTRFLPVMPRKITGYRELHPTPVPESIAKAWSHGIRRLARTALELRDAAKNEPKPGDDDQRDMRGRRLLTLKPDALDELDAFRSEIEPEFRDGGRLEKLDDFGGKLPAVAVRIAAAITLLGDVDADQIDADTMRGAIRVARAYIDHARAAFGSLTGADPADPMSLLVEWLHKQGRETVPQREAHRAFHRKPWAKTIKDIKMVADALEASHYIRQDELPTTARGGRRSAVWHVNPAVLGGAVTQPPDGDETEDGS